MAQNLVWASGNRIEDTLLAMQADSLAYAGQLRKAEELTAAGSCIRDARGRKGNRAGYEASRFTSGTIWQRYFGQTACRCRNCHDDGREVQFLAAMTYALAG